MMSKIIAIDFDGTLAEDNYPHIGEPIQANITRLKDEQANGAKIILWTCRRDCALENAVKWCAEHNIHFDAVNENLPEIIERFGGDTRKIYADVYIDDKND